ncbi:MAG: hypothetical protein EON54_23140 [Alcaligenaceae bacterium]|nr:MAG: hypothetical protein EON54_23140 [Alcaligenaceae bacterium]
MLSKQAEHFPAISEAWVKREVRNLGERAGIDYLPETAAEFVWRLLGILAKSILEQLALQRLKHPRPALADDIPFCDPHPKLLA